MRIQAPYAVALCLSAPASFAAQVESLGSMPGTTFVPHLISEDGDVIAGDAVNAQSREKVGV